MNPDIFGIFYLKQVIVKKILAFYLFLFSVYSFAQTKVSGIVLDDKNKPISYSTIAFKNSPEGVMTDENGKFYLESKKTYTTLNWF